jgi:hypothetical protein
MTEEKPSARLMAWRVRQPWIVSVFLWDLVLVGVACLLEWWALSTLGVENAGLIAGVMFLGVFPVGLLAGSFRRSSGQWWPKKSSDSN